MPVLMVCGNKSVWLTVWLQAAVKVLQAQNYLSINAAGILYPSNSIVDFKKYIFYKLACNKLQITVYLIKIAHITTEPSGFQKKKINCHLR